MIATTSIQPPSTSPGSSSRRIASTKIQIEIATSVTPFASAARISARLRPNVRCGVAGRWASQTAKSASPSETESESMCACVGEQREAAGEKSADDLRDEERRGEDQYESERALASLARMVVL